ncbi:MAG: methyltransferase domain-containing protein [Xanthomonadales bacterium]|nr:methyltransferase domain-containing protein [Xanthomonadales bacterium]
MREDVKEYYGRILTGSVDLQTNACCTDDDLPSHLKPLLARLHPEILSRYYGCGLIAPELLDGARVLDLGCGSGRDCYVLAQLVGESGEVVGVDMTEAQLAVARQQLEFHRDAFGFSRSNVRFLEGYIEALDELELEPGSFDVIVSNCVINLSPDKEAVLSQAYRLLKSGGEMYFSDVYADRRVPAALQKDQALYGECLAGALYWNDFLALAGNAGFVDPRLVADRPISIDAPEMAEKLAGIRFFSATYRLFKVAGLEPDCEDYGQAVRYRGTVPNQPDALVLDRHHRIETGRVFPVCGNTYRILRESRFAPHFDFYGTWERHFGIFEGCGKALPFTDEADGQAGCC